ncbi:hypothetical protein [Thauera chlorobenzoica]|uniref:Uncharacterized protein n=1 Tax=Thauera chlorobenzoica TaxID=96773 RepID=A0A1H5RLW2_9RHOO|nr:MULTISPECIES: hypothetical protein [Thauera]APR05271.1 hypothetical protein Tchl_2436 [Thauera chlorobenzoica]MCK2127257.1 hypothetical protein [Thauera aromatica]SEF39345.1 hypothetical protein SAMN05216242_10129 [Thauera chlorobenzoica]
MSYDYNAEATGHVIGLRRGYEQGHAAGYADGHNDVVARWHKEVEEQWGPLVDRLTAERDEAIRARDELLEQVRHAGQQTRKWSTAFYSLLCALDSALEVLQDAPQTMRTRMVVDFAKRAEYMHEKGWIDSMPQDNSVVRSRARKTADQLAGWWNQVVHHAKKAAEADRNQSPSP